MTTQIRDTQFGHFVRLVSGNKIFLFPDEIDPLLWRKSIQQSSPTPRSEDPESAVLEKSENENVSAENSARITDPHDQSQTLNRTVENGKEVYLVDWYGPDDPENPRNWSESWKAFMSLQICIFNFAVYMASSIYVPGELDIMGEFGIGETVATLGLSLFSLGYGVGPMLWSPMSEMPIFGRSAIYCWTLLGFVLFQLPTGFAVNAPMFLVFRFVTGFFGSPCLATGGGTIMDIYDPARAAYWLCLWGSFGVLGPVFGPIIGGFVVPAKGWRWTIWIITWFCSAVLLLLFFCMPETSAANILLRRAKRLRKETGDNRLKSQSEIDAAHHKLKDDLLVLAGAFTLTFSEPVVFSADLYTALVYGLLFIWFESFPLVFGDIYGFDLGSQGLVFLGIFVGALITVPLFLLWVRYGIVARFTKPGFKPEMLLPPTFFGAISLPICLFWYGWSARASVHWIVPIIGSSFFTVGIVTIFNPMLNYLGLIYPANAASIFAGNGLFRASFGAIFPLFARQLFRRLGVGPGNSLLGGLAICFIPLPYIFYRYGPKIRHMSKRARHDV